jgi:transposase
VPCAQPGPLHAFYERLRAGRGHGITVVVSARKLTVLFWCRLTREEQYAHQQPSLTSKKLRRLELTAGAKKWSRGRLASPQTPARHSARAHQQPNAVHQRRPPRR